jgi:creatinine amidohydrolase
MNWEEMTSPEFAKAVRKSKGVCLLPVGVVEKHGDHLPLGTDYLSGKALAARAAEREPVVVFPPYYFGSISEARHQPGTIAVRARLFIDLLENVCEEIARNGLRKIVLLNAHGGNRFLPHFVRIMLEKERDFTVYLIDLNCYLPGNDPGWQAMRETTVDDHGGESETSTMLVYRPDLVKTEAVSKRAGMPLRRLGHLPVKSVGISWYADFPDHYAGDARPASLKKGRYIVDRAAEKIAAILKAIKRDRVSPRLTREFYRRSSNPANG